MAELWTTESVLKKHNLWRELAGPLAVPTAINLQFQDQKIDALTAQLAELVAALEILADIPLESFDKHNKPDYPLMGWNGHVLKVHHVLAARAAIAKANAHL